ncbi:S53 family peptidase [Paraburkholderia hiiakae]|nr:S53 family peptidase [Paraburkholderia hiiakae]
MGARRVGPADPDEGLSVTIWVRRSPDASPLPDAQRWQMLPVSARQYLTREEIERCTGASRADLDAVAGYAHTCQLTVHATSVARRTVVVTGTVRQIEAAFAVELSRYESDTERYRGREGYIYVPAELGDIVQGVFGLDNRRMARSAGRFFPGGFENNLRPPNTQPLTPREVAGLYDFPFTYALDTPLTGAGQTIALIEFETGGDVGWAQGGYDPADIAGFFNAQGLLTPNVFAVSVDGATNNPVGDPKRDLEMVADIDVAGSVAQGANLAVYFSNWTLAGWVDVIHAVVHPEWNAQGESDPTKLPAGVSAPSVVSISWGWAELEPGIDVDGSEWTKSTTAALREAFECGSMAGMTFFAATGDDGSRCQIGDHSAHVLYPASDPYVTACGGTMIVQAPQLLPPRTGDREPVAVESPFTEHTWNDLAWAPSGKSTGVTGGGVSQIVGVQSWQSEANVPPLAEPPTLGRPIQEKWHRGRGIPDIAGNASLFSGYALWYQGAPTTTTLYMGSPIGHFYGTSVVAPLYAGLAALIASYFDHGIGWLNPLLYARGATSLLRDVDDGISNAVGHSPGYKSGPMWDACTGWGSVNGRLLLEVLVGAPFGISGTPNVPPP